MILSGVLPILKNRKFYFILSFLIVLCIGGFCQVNNQLDSLITLYESGTYNKQKKLSILKQIGDQYNDPEKILFYSDLLIQEAKRTDSIQYVYVGLTQRGSAYQLKSDYGKALESYFEAIQSAKKKFQLGSLYIQIGDVFSLMNNHNNAVNYYQKAIAILKKENDPQQVAMAVYNLGDEYLKADKLDSAIKYTQEAQTISKKINYKIGEAYCLGNLGVIYLKSGKHKVAEENLNKSIDLLEGLNEYAAICEFLLSVSNINQQEKDHAAALQYANRSLDLATQYGLKNEISDANLKLSELYEQFGETSKSLLYYKAHVAYRDSVTNLETVQKVADLRTNYEVSQKQKEVNLLATKNKLRVAERNGFIYASLLLATILILSMYFYTQRAKRNKLLAAQKMQEAEIEHQKNLMQSVITSQEAERKRIGMDLHDEVGAALSTLRMTIDRDAEKMQGTVQVTTKYKLAIDKIITNMRHISHALSPRISGSYGFYDAVHEMADSINSSDQLLMTIDFDESNLPKFSNDQTPMALYRVIAELVNNTLKHAQAKNINLEVMVKENNLMVTYRDDGIGLAQSISTSSTGMGMNNIESRLNLIDADWQLNNPVTGGYEISINVPLN